MYGNHHARLEVILFMLTSSSICRVSKSSWTIMIILQFCPFIFSLIEVKFTEHIINHLKVYNPVAFSVFTLLCNHDRSLISKLFHHPTLSFLILVCYRSSKRIFPSISDFALSVSGRPSPRKEKRMVPPCVYSTDNY